MAKMKPKIELELTVRTTHVAKSNFENINGALFHCGNCTRILMLGCFPGENLGNTESFFNICTRGDYPNLSFIRKMDINVLE